MSEQQHGRRQTEESADEVEFVPAKQEQEQEQGFDSLLDEIDAVLESNAEEFVRGFVQKGGQ